MADPQHLDFTDYVLSLDGSGNPPSRELFEAVWDQLRRVLIKEMKIRGLWSSPPSYLGITGSSWTQEALDELVADCYTFTFVRRFPGLKKQLLVQDNVTGTVFRNIRQFLTDAQKHADPLGYKVFERLKAAIDELIGSKRLHVLSGDARIRNNTLLGFRPSSSNLSVADEMELEEAVRVWADHLLPELLLARGKERVAVVGKLADDISGLYGKSQVQAFYFSDLIKPFKSGVRARWFQLWQASEGELVFQEDPRGKASAKDWRVDPDLAWQERQYLRQVQHCVDRKIEQSVANKRTVQYLASYWSFARDFAQGAQSSAVSENRGKMPSDVVLAKSLGIPRGRIPGLRKSLGEMLDLCRGDAVGAKAPPPAVQIPGRERLEERLRRETESAAELHRRKAMRVEVRKGEAPQPGDVFTAKAGDGVLELLVLERDESRDQLVVVPVDDHPSRGPADVNLAVISTAALARFGLQSPVEAQVLDAATRTDHLEPEQLNELLRLRDTLDLDPVDLDPVDLGAVDLGAVDLETPGLETVDPGGTVSIPWLQDELTDSNYLEQMDLLEVALSQIGLSATTLAIPVLQIGDSVPNKLGRWLESGFDGLQGPRAFGNAVSARLGRGATQIAELMKKIRAPSFLLKSAQWMGASFPSAIPLAAAALPVLTKGALLTTGVAVLAASAIQSTHEQRSVSANEARSGAKHLPATSKLPATPISCERYADGEGLEPCYSLPLAAGDTPCCCDGVACTKAMCHFEICCPQGTFPGGGECNLKRLDVPNSFVDVQDAGDPTPR